MKFNNFKKIAAGNPYYDLRRFVVVNYPVPDKVKL